MKKRLFFTLICLLFNNCRLPSDSIIAGCMDTTAVNYNIDATLDDCSCIFNNEEFDCFQVSVKLCYRIPLDQIIHFE